MPDAVSVGLGALGHLSCPVPAAGPEPAAPAMLPSYLNANGLFLPLAAAHEGELNPLWIRPQLCPLRLRLGCSSAVPQGRDKSCCALLTHGAPVLIPWLFSDGQTRGGRTWCPHGQEGDAELSPRRQDKLGICRGLGRGWMVAEAHSGAAPRIRDSYDLCV